MSCLQAIQVELQLLTLLLWIHFLRLGYFGVWVEGRRHRRLRIHRYLSQMLCQSEVLRLIWPFANVIVLFLHSRHEMSKYTSPSGNHLRKRDQLQKSQSCPKYPDRWDMSLLSAHKCNSRNCSRKKSGQLSKDNDLFNPGQWSITEFQLQHSGPELLNVKLEKERLSWAQVNKWEVCSFLFHLL